MAARKSTFGIFAAPVRPTTAQPPMDPVKQKLIETLDQIKEGVQIQQVAALGKSMMNPDGNGGSPPPPPATTVSDALQVAKFASDMSKAAAEVAVEQAKRLEEELEETKEQAGVAYEQGKREAETIYGVMLTMVKEMAQANQQALLEMQKVREEMDAKIREAEKRANEAEKVALEKRLDQIEARFTEQIQQREQKIQELESRLQQAASKRSWEEELAEIIRSGKKDHPMLQLAYQLSGAGSHGESFDEWYRKEEARRNLLWQDMHIQHHAALLAQEREREAKKAELVDDARQWGTRLIGALEQFARAGNTKLPQSKWPEGVSLDG
jgi:DNA repair exonuclease SbcCD ATPase subunit